MDKQALLNAREFTRSELTACINFWLENGLDKVNGGMYTCLDRKGKIYSTDKSVWMQGRAAWTFAYLCKIYGKRDEWMNAAKSCLDFLESHCINREKQNRMYFTVTADGKPLRQRRYCFSEGFYAIANAEYYGLTGEIEYLERAKRAYELIYMLNNGLMEDPVNMGPKTIPETRQGIALADPMIYLNITSVLRKVDPANEKLYSDRAQECVERILKYHVKPDLKCTLETVGLNGEFQSEFTAGRMVNPGHDIECSWFMLEYANYIDDKELHGKAQQIFDWAIQDGWDNEYGGILYFKDCLGNPPEAYEHDMKLWWPHNEALIASLMLYRDTGDEKYWSWYTKTLDYCKKYFHDDENPEWYGYLRRDGMPTMPSSKGSTFKGPFHLPRSLIMTDVILTELIG